MLPTRRWWCAYGDAWRDHGDFPREAPSDTPAHRHDLPGVCARRAPEHDGECAVRAARLRAILAFVSAPLPRARYGQGIPVARSRLIRGARGRSVAAPA